MPKKIQIVSDFVCPYCYYLEALLRQVEERMELDVTYLPYELTAPPAPQEDPYHDPVRRAHYAETLDPVCRELGLTMHLPPRVSPRPYTRLAFEGFFAAQAQGQGAAYYQRVFRAYFEEERDIGDLAVLTALAAEAGVESTSFRAALESGTYAAEEQAAVCRAKDTLHIRMVPTVLAGDRRLEGFVPSLQALETWLRETEAQKITLPNHDSAG